MRYHQLRTLARWSLKFGPGLIICTLVAVTEPESPAFYGPLALYIAALAVFAVMVIREARSGDTLRHAVGPGAVVFVTQNLPSAIVHLESYLLPNAAFARGATYTVRAGDDGIGYFTPGTNPELFVRIPWAEIAEVGEVGGELGIWLDDGNLLHLVPGGQLPVSVRRVRALAAQISALQPQRQP